MVCYMVYRSVVLGGSPLGADAATTPGVGLGSRAWGKIRLQEWKGHRKGSAFNNPSSTEFIRFRIVHAYILTPRPWKGGRIEGARPVFRVLSPIA